MIVEKAYKVVLLDGSEPSTLYNTMQDAVRAHRGNIKKLVEVLPKVTKKKVEVTHDQLLKIVVMR